MDKNKDSIHKLNRYKFSPDSQYETLGFIRRVNGDDIEFEQLCQFKNGVPFWMRIIEIDESTLPPFVDEIVSFKPLVPYATPEDKKSIEDLEGGSDDGK
tara:strand:+ start:2000 stop:2296 length:297 start_codon:yes stop_codon:yes gene_type:complete